MDSCTGPEDRWKRPVGAKPGQVSLSHSLVLRSARCAVCHRVFIMFNSEKPSTTTCPRMLLPGCSEFWMFCNHRYSIDLLLTTLYAVTIYF